MNLLKLAAGVLLLIALFELQQYLKLQRLTKVGNSIAASAVPFERFNSDAELQFLGIGDSSMVGTGASHPGKSTMGLLVAGFPLASIKNRGVNGAKVADVLKTIRSEASSSYDLAVIQVGGNDIVRRTDFGDFEKDLRAIVDVSRSIADQTIILHGGDIGDARILPIGVRWFFTKRSMRPRDMYIQIAAEFEDVSYADIIGENRTDEFHTDSRTFYAEDDFHPNDKLYRYWYDQIKQEIRLETNE